MFVAFFDVLGAAELVSRASEEEMRDLEQWLSLGGADSRDGLSNEVRAVDDLLSTFQFETTLGVLNELQLYPHKRLEILHFSDSAFFVCEEVETLALLVHLLMMGFYGAGIPVRGGCGSGGYVRLEYSQRSGPGQRFIASNPFAGSGVVNAYRAESCGNKGPRVFLHPSIVSALAEFDAQTVVPLPSEESCGSATHEFNLLLWRVRRPPLGLMGDDHGSAARIAERYFASLDGMRRKSPSAEHHHYDAARSALTRMLASFAAS